MKVLMKSTIAGVILAATVSGGLAFAADGKTTSEETLAGIPAKASNAQVMVTGVAGSESATGGFATLAGIPAQAMNVAQMDQVQGGWLRMTYNVPSFGGW